MNALLCPGSSAAPARLHCRALCSVLTLVLAACGAPDDSVDPASEVAEPIRTVITGVVEDATVPDEITLSAEVAPWAAVTVTAEVTGRVEQVPVEVGDRVSEGDPLARLDPVDASALLLQAEAVLQQARAAADQAARDVARGEQLAETKDISVGELDALALASDTAAARVTEAEAALSLAREQLDDTVVRAPFDGVVSDRAVEIGSWLSPGAPVVRVVDEQRLRVRAAASQLERARLRPGMPVRIAAGALVGESFSGEVRVLGAEADPATGTYRVETWIDRPRTRSGATLLPGMHATMVVQLAQITGVWAPRAALVDTPDGPVVFVVDGERVRAVRPGVGHRTPSVVEILNGLVAGDSVVVQGQHVLSDGDPVQVSGP